MNYQHQATRWQSLRLFLIPCFSLASLLVGSIDASAATVTVNDSALYEAMKNCPSVADFESQFGYSPSQMTDYRCRVDPAFSFDDATQSVTTNGLVFFGLMSFPNMGIQDISSFGEFNTGDYLGEVFLAGNLIKSAAPMFTGDGITSVFLANNQIEDLDEAAELYYNNTFYGNEDAVLGQAVFPWANQNIERETADATVELPGSFMFYEKYLADAFAYNVLVPHDCLHLENLVLNGDGTATILDPTQEAVASYRISYDDFEDGVRAFAHLGDLREIFGQDYFNFVTVRYRYREPVEEPAEEDESGNKNEETGAAPLSTTPTILAQAPSNPETNDMGIALHTATGLSLFVLLGVVLRTLHDNRNAL